MSIKTYQFLAPFHTHRISQRKSERELALQAHVSRLTLRSVEQGNESLSIHSCVQVANALGQDLALLSWSQTEEMHSEFSSIAVSMRVSQEGFTSWKGHFFDLVDEMRRTWDPRLVLLPPVKDLDQKLQALLSSIVLSLCSEGGLDAPHWALRSWFLPSPWFVSEVESLRAMSLLESPIYFRKNNIFVLENFLKRA